MSLNWSIEQVENYKEHCWTTDDEGNVRLNPTTEALVWLTLAVGLGEISDKNVDEFYARVVLVEKLDGGYLIKDGKPAYLTVEDVRAHIGLTTNVTDETRAKWMKRYVGNALDGLTRHYNKMAKANPFIEKETAEPVEQS